MRILLDINILVRANEQSYGPARALLLTLLEQGHVLLMSPEMFMELAGTFRYPRLQRLYELTDEQVYNYIQFLKEVAEFVSIDPFLAVPMRDPKDIAVLQTAVAGAGGRHLHTRPGLLCACNLGVLCDPGNRHLHRLRISS